jgi:hypothetical protein
MRMRDLLVGLMTVAMAGIASAQAPTPPPTASPSQSQQDNRCKEVVTAKARSAAQLSDASRESRARENATANWRRRARDTYGWRYRFWSKAQERQVKCGGGASAKHCTVSAKPCRIF